MRNKTQQEEKEFEKKTKEDKYTKYLYELEEKELFGFEKKKADLPQDKILTKYEKGVLITLRKSTEERTEEDNRILLGYDKRKTKERLPSNQDTIQKSVVQDLFENTKLRLVEFEKGMIKAQEALTQFTIMRDNALAQIRAYEQILKATGGSEKVSPKEAI